MRFSYSKADRLSNSKDIEKLFREGKAFFSFPLKMIIADSASSDQAIRSAVIVPKKKLSKANQRNRVKRQLREIIRLELPNAKINNSHLLNAQDFLLIYTHHKPNPDYATLEKAFQSILQESSDEAT